MTKFSLVWVGKPARRGPEHDLAQVYLKRIGHQLPIEEVVIKPAATASGDSKSAIAKESQRILARLKPDDYLVLLDERGATMSSVAFSAFVEKRRTGPATTVVWLIGGSQGVSPELTERSDFMLSLSKMTLPHALARVLLLEQIFRALCIRAGHPYHH